jgi:uncharacterized protein (TIGR03435 family)
MAAITFTLTWADAPNGVPAVPPVLRGDKPVVSEPTGGGKTLFEAVEKLLGLKLEKRKRAVPTLVIDHLDENPVEN